MAKKAESVVVDATHTLQCTNGCGIVYNQVSKAMYCPSETAGSLFTSVTSLKDGAGAWHVYVGGQTDKATLEISVKGTPVTVSKYTCFIIELDASLQPERVISFSSTVNVDKLTAFNNQLVALLSADTSATITINNNEKQYTVDSGLFTETYITLLVTDFGAETLTVRKIIGASASIQPIFTDFFSVSASSALISVSYLIPKSTTFVFNGETSQASASSSQPYTFIIRASSGGTGTDFTSVNKVNSEVPGAVTMSSSFLSENLIAVCHTVGSDSFPKCPANSVTLSIYYVNGTLKAFRCSSILNSADVYSLAAPYDDNFFVFASSFKDYFFTDGIELWRNARTTATSQNVADVPFIALVHKDTLAFADARVVFNQTDPAEAMQPVGLSQKDKSYFVLYSGSVPRESSFTFRRVQFSADSCDNGLFDTTGKCICFNGGVGDKTNPCKAQVSSSSLASSSGTTLSSSKTTSSIESKPSSYGSVASQSQGPTPPTPVVVKSSVASSALDEKSFISTSTALIIFVCTTVAFLAVSVVFIILFSKKHCGSSSSGSVEMDG